MDFSTYTAHSHLARANAERLGSEIETRRRNAETMAARAAGAAACTAAVRVIRRAVQLVTSHA